MYHILFWFFFCIQSLLLPDIMKLFIKLDLVFYQNFPLQQVFGEWA